ncbi:rhamnogalacturonan acetylesterase [Curtobacterium ammoniigenes]|uniref:rhamnogalacturonan acetylesterase n=1 Tax=Curtobacterium ammoniigenes TaxID=395387 RepID=UPI000832D62F|nr:rhamnogalacturonan acetylesterase [Curtobacterium ammoniigenes]
MSILLAGDSTVAPPKPEEFPLSGWGGALHEFVPDRISNHAVGGATTTSFIEEGRWSALLAELRDDDTVIIQFGHNDQKYAPLVRAIALYRANLRAFVLAVRARGAHPVLATSPERRLFSRESLRRSHGPFPQIVRDLGHDLGVPVIDLTAFTRWLYVWLGPDDSRKLFVHLEPGVSAHWPEGVEDNTHFTVEGARAIACFVAESLAAIRRVGEDANPIGKWGVQP